MTHPNRCHYPLMTYHRFECIFLFTQDKFAIKTNIFLHFSEILYFDSQTFFSVDLHLPLLGEMLLIMEHILEDMVPSDGILTTLTMKELAIVVDKNFQDYFSLFKFSSLNSSYFSLILPKLSFLLSYRKINFVDIFLKIVLIS